MMSVAVAGSMMFTSCIGSFGLTNKLLDWNKEVDENRFINTLVFVAFHIVPVYPITVVADALVLNSIEFWSGDNPIADVGTVKEITTENGMYAIETKEDGYTITKDGENEVVELIFDKTDKTWTAKQGDNSCKLLQFKDNDEVVMFLPDGSSVDVELSEAGVLAFRQIADNYSFYAAR